MAWLDLSKQNLHVKCKPFSYTLLRFSFQQFNRLDSLSRLDRSPYPEMRNHTPVVSFILLGLTEDSQMQILVFIFLLIISMLSIIGNLITITLILVDSHLKMVMYFFLQNFSFLKYSLTSACTPRFLSSISTGDRSIMYNACVAQLFLTYMFGITEQLQFQCM